MPVLRPYQEAAVSACLSAFDQDQNPILVSPTGSGKTVTGVALSLKVGARILWVAHRRELIFQAAEAVAEAGGDAGVILAGEEASPDAPFQVASVQTLARRTLPPADLLVIDEAHHATSKGYKRLIDEYPKRLGLTATPFRLDGKGLGSAGFRAIVVAAWCDDLCTAGTLHEPIVFASPAPDLTGVHKVAGDYNTHELGEAVRRDVALYGRVIANWQKLAKGRRTVVFAVDIAHATALTQAFADAGVTTEIVTGETPKSVRAGTLARLAAGTTTVVVNVGVLTEGWDLPALECAVIARPTASLCLHLQQIGRIMRACEGKTGAIVLDHAGNVHRHGVVTDRLVYSLDGRVKKAKGVAPCKECPDCGRTVPAGVHFCPECGYEFEQKDRTSESDDDLTCIGAADSFDRRRYMWGRFLNAGMSIARWDAAKSGMMWSTNAERKGYAIATAKFKARYGRFPLHLKGRLIDPDSASEGERSLLFEQWVAIGRAKGWSSSYCESFARKCEAEAFARRQKAGSA